MHHRNADLRIQCTKEFSADTKEEWAYSVLHSWQYNETVLLMKNIKMSQ